jgi:hypothetical protein
VYADLLLPQVPREPSAGSPGREPWEGYRPDPTVDVRATLGGMSLFSIVRSPTFDRAVFRAGRAADFGLAGRDSRRKPERAPTGPTPEQRAAGRLRVIALFGRVPVLGPDEPAPQS